MCSTKLEDLNRMDNVLDIFHIPKLNQDQVNSLNSAIAPQDIEAVIKSLSTKNIPSAYGFRTEFYHNVLLSY